jgi:hypothetical protein
MATQTWKVQRQRLTTDNKNIDSTIVVSMNDK